MPYNDPNKFKDIARQKLIKAVYRGKIKRPNKCQFCHIQCTPQGHHYDYELPLDVIWLCTSCHGEEHAGWLEEGEYFEFDFESAVNIAKELIG